MRIIATARRDVLRMQAPEERVLLVAIATAFERADASGDRLVLAVQMAEQDVPRPQKRTGL